MAKGVPLALSHNVRCNRVLQEKVLLVAVAITEQPRMSDGERVVATPISDDMTRVELALRIHGTAGRAVVLISSRDRARPDQTRRSVTRHLLYRPRDHYPIRTAPGHGALA